MKLKDNLILLLLNLYFFLIRNQVRRLTNSFVLCGYLIQLTLRTQFKKYFVTCNGKLSNKLAQFYVTFLIFKD